MRSVRRKLVALAIATATLSGCAGEDPHPEPVIDLAALQTGSYPTTARDVNGVKADLTGAALEAIRLGQHVPLPYDVDRRYLFNIADDHGARVTPELPRGLSGINKEDYPALTAGLITGWHVGSESRYQTAVGRSARFTVLRFGTSAEASAAAGKIAEKQRTSLPGDSLTIAGHPGALAVWRRTGTFNSWLANDTLAIGIHLTDPMSIPADPTFATDFAAKAYTKLLESLSHYAPTPVDRMAALPVDIDGLLSRTLPSDKDDWADGVPVGAAEPAAAALAREGNPGAATTAFSDSGVDIVASDAYARVYRATDPRAARRLMSALIDPVSEFYKTVDSPAALPMARCFEARDKSVNHWRHPPTCFVTFDRYVARVQGSQIQDLQHRIAAQYKLLAQ